MSYLLAIKKSASSLRGRQSEVSSACSDNSKREAKSSLYARPTYETLLAIKVSFMRSFSLGSQIPVRNYVKPYSVRKAIASTHTIL